MIAHIIHDKRGTIKSVVFQTTEAGGTLGIQTDNKDDLVTAVELSEVFPESAIDVGSDAGNSRHHLLLIARDIRERFRVDEKRKALERLKAA